MKKNVLKKLRTIAEGLPVVFEPFVYVVDGKELMETEKFDAAGKVIKPKKLYKQVEQRPIEHLNRLKAAYENGGDAAVAAYSKNATLLSAQQNKPVKRIINTL